MCELHPIHFVTSKPTNLRRYANDPEKLNEKIAAQKLGNYAQGQYQYDFQKDQTGQQTYYIRKLQQKFNDAAPNGTKLRL